MDRSKLKSITNMPLLRGLFYETTGADKSSVTYTLKHEDHEGFPSLYRLYMESDDPTEYAFATNYLVDWDHWIKLCECSWFKEHINAWRVEAEVRLRALSLKRIRSLAAGGGKEAFQADKWLATGGYKPEPRSKAGRPTKEQVSAAADQIATHNSRVEEDYDRILGKPN